METNLRKIGFNGRPFCHSGMRGLSRHTFELIRNLKAQHPELEIYVYAYDRIDDFYKDRLPFVKFRDRRVRPKLLWDTFLLSRDLRRDGVELFHSTINLGVPLQLWRKVPLFVTIHDHFTHAARIGWGKTPRAWWAALNYRFEFFLLRRSNAFLTVSETAKDEISRRLGLDPKKLTVAYNGTSLRTGAQGSKRGNYFLYVGGLEERKNVVLLLEAFLLFVRDLSNPPKLVIAGSHLLATPRVAELLKGHPEVFEPRQEVSDEELIKLYQNAQALVFPSLEEGFGLPLIEAMALGCPVIASDIPVFMEISREAALHFSPVSKEDLAEKLTELYHDEALKERLASAGLLRSEAFTWPKMAEKVYETYVKNSLICL